MKEEQMHVKDAPLQIRKVCKPECRSHQIVNADGRKVSFVIHNVTVNDHGTYECSWNNSNEHTNYRIVKIGSKSLLISNIIEIFLFMFLLRLLDLSSEQVYFENKLIKRCTLTSAERSYFNEYLIKLRTLTG